MTHTPAPSARAASKLSKHVWSLGYDGSPLPLAEWLQLRTTIRSMPGVTGSERIMLPPVIVFCASCGVETIKTGADVNKNEQRGLTRFYCSNACWGQHANDVRHGERRCVTCGERAPKAVSFGRDKTPFCSLVCMEADRTRRKAETRAAWPVRTCSECNTDFAMARRETPGDVYCSGSCANRAHSRLMSGTGNPKYKDGATPLRQQPHSAKAFRDMRPLILERDQMACVVCQQTTDLHVHHLDNWPMNNAASNLVTLCAKCHRRWHGAWEAKPQRILWPWLSEYAKRPLSTISRSKGKITSSPTASSSTTA